MPHTLASLLVHVVFSTKNRAPEISSEVSQRLFSYMGGIARELKAGSIIINGPADHVHALLSIPPTTSVSDLVRVLRTNFSRWVHEQFPERQRFAWQSGYGAFTVSNSRAEEVRAYIASQCGHDRRVSSRRSF